MNLTSQENILKVLTAFNPWWKSGTVRPEFAKTYKRFAFYETTKILGSFAKGVGKIKVRKKLLMVNPI